MTHTLTARIKDSASNESELSVFLTRDLDFAGRNVDKTVYPLEGEFGTVITDPDDAFIRRLINWFHTAQYDVDPASMWGEISVAQHKSFIDMLNTGNIQGLHEYLQCLYQQPLMHGICQGLPDYTNMKNNPDVMPNLYLKRYYDCMLGLLEYLGVITPQNHEQGPTYFHMDVNHLVSAMPDWLIPPHWQGGLFGLKTNRGLWNDRIIMSLYIALKVKEKVGNQPVAEIGGGAGFVAYWLYVLGYQRITLVDLAPVAIGQAYQLAKNFGADKICLPGEYYNGQPIRFVNAADFITSKEKYQCVINSDSMPEMDIQSLRQYLTTIANHAFYFFSVNQESESVSYITYEMPGKPGEYQKTRKQHNVRRVIKQEYPNEFTRLERNKFWLRDGYTEEWYHTQINPVQ